jgi:hypothetical protein
MENRNPFAEPLQQKVARLRMELAQAEWELKRSGSQSAYFADEDSDPSKWTEEKRRAYAAAQNYGFGGSRFP